MAGRFWPLLVEIIILVNWIYTVSGFIPTGGFKSARDPSVQWSSLDRKNGSTGGSFLPSTIYDTATRSRRTIVSLTHRQNTRTQIILQASTDRSSATTTRTKTTTTTTSSATFDSYESDGYTLTYRYKPAASGYENQPSVLLVHPVGIGLCSWFWERFLDNWIGPAVYAPNLIGCGISEGSDRWDPDDRGLSFPLGWVGGCETLMKERAVQKQSVIPFLNKLSSSERKWTVITQGGLAPVGVMLAARNPELVSALVLASPPTWREMTTPVPESELANNYNFLRSPMLGKLAFDTLESRWSIRFFSNRFLFSSPCDEDWLDNTENEFCIEARPPVMAFNAGFCRHRSFEEELLSLRQQVVIMEGQDDKRRREEYVQFMKNCRKVILPGQNVLPWESSIEFVNAVKDETK